MTTKKREELERLLGESEIPEPPADLLDKIKNEIPAELPQADTPFAQKRTPWWAWRAAASLFVLIGIGYLAFRFGLKEGYDPTQERNASIVQSESTAAPAPQATDSLSKRETESLNAMPEVRQQQTPSDAPRAAAAAPEKEGRLRREKDARDAAATSVTEAITIAPATPAPPATAEAPLRDEMKQRRADRGLAVTGGAIGSRVANEPQPEPSRPTAKLMAQPSVQAVQAPPPPSEEGKKASEQAFGENYFRDYGVNPFVDAEEDPLSTFGLDVDTASYTVARRYLSEGRLPPPEAIRPEEFLNFFEYGDPAPSKSDFAIYADGGESPFPRSSRSAMVRFTIRARSISTPERAPAILTFVIDTSGSMARENRLGLVKNALNVLLDELWEDDKVGLITFGTNAQVLLEPTTNHDAIRDAVAQLTPQGSTNAAEGLRLGYETAAEAFRRGSNNRVILLSDGVANVGATTADSILRQVDQLRSRGIMLTTVGVGMGNFNDVLLEQLADRGNGHYAYVDDLDEARRVFVENLTGTLQTVAEDARVQVHFNPRAVKSYRLIGYENRDIADQRFRDDQTDAGEIGAGHSVTALYEIEVQPEISLGDEVAALTLRYRPAEGGNFREVVKKVRAREIAQSWENSSVRFQLATVVASFAELLKQSYGAREIDPDQLVSKAQAVADRLPNNKNVTEITNLVRRAADLVAPREED